MVFMARNIILLLMCMCLGSQGAENVVRGIHIGSVIVSGWQQLLFPEPEVSVEPEAAETATQPIGPSSQDTMDYIQSLYQDDGKETPVDYNRYSIVRVGGIEFAITWSVDVSEDLVKVVVNEDGTVTIDINEQCEQATPYVLTATITYNGETVSHSWNYILPEAQDMVEIVKAAYALSEGEALPYQTTLTGTVTKIETPYDPIYNNITVVIVISGCENQPILCYRLTGNDIDTISVGDTLTVTGILHNYKGTIEFDIGCQLI